MPLISTFGSGSSGGYGQFRQVSLGGGSAAVTGDSGFRYVTLFLSGDGANGSNNNVFLDSSSSPYTITRNGNSAQGTFTPYGSNWSNYFDGSGDYIDTPTNSAFSFPGDFCVEGWFYQTTRGSNGALLELNSYVDGILLRLGSGGFDNLWINGVAVVSPSQYFPINQWNHFAITRSGSTVRLFSNGLQVWSGTVSATINSANGRVRIGDILHSSGQNFFGYVSNFRIVKGSSVYTSDFAPSTTPFTAISNTVLLTCQSNHFIDNSTNAFTITKSGDVTVNRFSPFASSSAYSAVTNGGSVYFDGTGDYLKVSSGTPLNFGSSNFTVEFWIYPMKVGAAMVFLSSKDNGTQSGDIDIRCDYIGTSSTTFYIYGGGTNFSASFTGNILNRWTHVALVRNGGTVTFYLNGVSVGSGAGGTQGTTNLAAINIGGGSGLPSAGYENVTGYISGLRVVNGSAVYTGAFTPPTTPPSNITNTTFLANFTNAGIVDGSMMNDLETVGDTQISTSVFKYGTGSIYFDGTGDYLTQSSGQQVSFGTGDFTIEAWIYFLSTAYPAQSGIMFGSGVGWTLYIYPSNRLQWGTISPQSPANLLTGNTTLTTGRWYHIAVTRRSGTVNLWVDGVSDGSVSDTSNYSASGILQIGLSHSNYPFYGYMDDLRITKGLARYQSNFTPPTQQLSAFGSNAPSTVEYLVLAGGGGGGGGSNAGGYTGGGGGGAGGLRTGIIDVVNGVTYNVTVGAGGSAGAPATFGSNGSSSVFSSITSNGGGRGSNGAGIAYDGTGGGGGGAGGSGGGSGYRFTVGGAGTSGQGNNGGFAGTGEEGSGGGGGAGAVGSNGSTSPAQYTGGNGGAGANSSITGTLVTYAGGGGAGGLGDGGYDGKGGTGGIGGGGTGGGRNGVYTTPGGDATAGTTNLGGGGGGGTRNVGGNTPALGAAGGSGVVIIRYPDTFAAATTTTGSPQITNAGGYRIYRWTGSGSITF